MNLFFLLNFILQQLKYLSLKYLSLAHMKAWGAHWCGRKLECLEKTWMSIRATTIPFHIITVHHGDQTQVAVVRNKCFVHCATWTQLIFKYHLYRIYFLTHLSPSQQNLDQTSSKECLKVKGVHDPEHFYRSEAKVKSYFSSTGPICSK